MTLRTKAIFKDENGSNAYALAVLHNAEAVAHVIDDDAENKLQEPALLYVGGAEIGDIKVMLSNGADHVIPNYNRSQTFMVLKVYATGTDVTLSNIKLYR